MESENHWTSINTNGIDSFIYPGSTERPPLNTTNLRLYDHPLCPFAERARLALSLRNIEYQRAYVDGNDKPEFFVESGGTVPILEKLDGSIINESHEIINYALQEGNGEELVEEDETVREQQKKLADSLFDGYFKLFFKSFVDPIEEEVDALMEKFQKFEDLLGSNVEGNKFFNNSSKFTMVDLLLQGTVQRSYDAFKHELIPFTNFDESKYPAIGEYLINVRSIKKISDVLTPIVPGINHFSNIKRSKQMMKLPYPIDHTPIKDSQSLKKLYILNGSTAKPRTNETHIRFYGHPLCPFAERALLAFKAKGIEHQFVGIDLTTKNKWHLDVNGGLIPFLEFQNGEFVIESLGVADWVQDFTQDGVDLYPGDESNKSKIKESVQSLFTSAIELIIAPFREGDGVKFFTKSFYDLNEELEKSSTGYFLNQEHETMADLMTFPFVHRAFLLKETSFKEKYNNALDFTKIQKIQAWYITLAEKYPDCITKGEDFSELIDKSIAAAEPTVQLYYPIPSEQ